MHRHTSCSRIADRAGRSIRDLSRNSRTILGATAPVYIVDWIDTLAVRIIVTIVFVSACLDSIGQAQQVLQWKLHPGQVIQVELQQDTTTQQSSFGRELQSQARMSMQMDWEVLSISAEGVAQIAQTVKKVAMDMSSPGGPRIQFDTSQAEASQGMAQTLRDNVQPMIGLTVLQRMNPHGEILDARLAPESLRILEQAPSGKDVQRMFSNEDMQSLVSQSAAVLPRRPVVPGDTWKSTSTTMSPLGELQTTMLYTYRGSEPRKEGSLERIDVDTSVQVIPTDSNPMTITVSDQKSQGTMWFDARAGMFVQSNLQQSMSLRTNIGEAVQEHALTTQMQVQFRPTEARPNHANANRTEVTPTSTRR